MIPEHQELHTKLKSLDRMLWKQDDEVLHYILKRTESILNHRAEEKL